MTFKKLLIISLPPLSLQGPYLGPCLISSHAKKLGFQTILKDLNLSLALKHSEFMDALEKENFSPKNFGPHLSKVNSIIDEWLQENPTHVGLSGMTFNSLIFANYVATYIKSKKPLIITIMGGAVVDFSLINFTNKIEESVFDFIVEGTAFKAIDLILNEQITEKRIRNLPFAGEVPLPDYSDLPIELYGQWANSADLNRPKGKVFYINNTTGCTQKCSFCSVPKQQQPFSQRDPSQVSSEITHVIENYNVDQFEFTDNLVNGSIPALKKLLNELETVKTKHPTFNWHGLAILRKKAQSPPELFDSLKKSGNTLLAFGVESGSPHVLKSMNKNYSPEDLIYTMEELTRVDINSTLLFIVGFPTETDEDFLETLHLLTSVSKYKKNIKNVRMSLFHIQTRSDVLENPGNYGVRFIGQSEWESDFVNKEVMMARKKAFVETCHLLGLPIRSS